MIPQCIAFSAMMVKNPPMNCMMNHLLIPQLVHNVLHLLPELCALMIEPGRKI